MFRLSGLFRHYQCKMFIIFDIYFHLEILQTIQEQQKVIRRLLKKTNSTDSLKHFSLNGNSEENNDLTGEQFTDNVFSASVELPHQLN